MQQFSEKKYSRVYLSMCLLLIKIIWSKSKPKKTYNPQQKSWHTFPLLQYLPGNLSVHPLPPSSMLFIMMKLSLLVYNIVGGEGFAYSSGTIRYWPQIACQRIFLLSDQGVPRTFVVDCTSPLYVNCYHPSSSGQALRKAEVLSLQYLTEK